MAAAACATSMATRSICARATWTAPAGPTAWYAVITSEAHGSRFGYRYINAKGTWAVTLKEMVALL